MPIEATSREAIAPAPNPLGLDGIEYIEFTTPKPQALGQLLESIGFRPVARHRSREILLYRQGPMNIVVNAHAGVTHVAAAQRKKRRRRSVRWRCACAMRGPPTSAHSNSAPGMCRCTPR